SPINGAATISGTDITYNPIIGFTGNDQLTYTINDGNGGTDSGVITIAVSAPANQNPVANDFTVTVVGNSTNNSINVASEISDPDGNPLMVAIGSPINGAATISGTDITYNPIIGFTGNDQLTYTINDGNGGTDSGVITIAVNAPANQNPVANDFTVNVVGNTTNNSINVASEISDPDGNPLMVAIGSPTSGTATISGTTINYNPTTGFTGNDQVTYTINDGNGGTDSGVITISVSAPANQPPVAQNFDVDANANTDAMFSLIPFISDDETDITNLIINIISFPYNGQAAYAGQLNIMYTPQMQWVGEDEIVYEIIDEGGLSDTGIISISVIGINQNRPVAVATSNVNSGVGPLEVQFTGSASFDSDPEDTISYLWNFGDGTSSIEADPLHTFTSIGPYNVTLTVTDDSFAPLTDTANIEITVSPPPAPDFLFTVLFNSGVPLNGLNPGDSVDLDFNITPQNMPAGANYTMTANWLSASGTFSHIATIRANGTSFSIDSGLTQGYYIDINPSGEIGILFRVKEVITGITKDINFTIPYCNGLCP
uniref:Ig-like domain-containing protein n=1 Tax=Cellulophaga baltica TaxID=76594 RepID=UPI002495836B